MRARFILSETWANLTRNLSMLLSLTLVTFISFLFIGASVLTQAQITKAKGDWYDKVEVVVWLCPDGTSQSANCASGKSPSANEITALQKTIRDELNDVVSNIDYVSKQDFYDSTFTKQYPNGEFQGRTLTADDMQDSLWLKLKDPTKYQVVSEVLSGKEGVEDVTDQRQIFDPVFAVLNRATAVTAVLAGVMVVVAILLTGTTIRMSAASRRTETESIRHESTEPISEAMAPSRMNGRRIVQFEAPTYLMISVSVRLDAADIRMVVPVSRMATTTITPASTAVTAVARLSTANTGSKNWRWSVTSSTPSLPESTSETT